MSEQGKLPTIRAITRGPKYHWFGYYDKLEFDPSQRYVLGMEVDFEGRSPRAEDEIRVGMVDLHDNDRWIELGTSRAWCWQQGCMLQWRPGSQTEVMWNDRQGDRFVCHILDLRTGRRRTLPHPFYTVSPDGRSAAAPDFRRINDMRPGYGYAGPPDPHAGELAPEGSGIWRLDLETGEQALILSLAEIASIPFPADRGRPGADLSAPRSVRAAKHWFNHLLYNPDGTRLEFLHRWRLPDQPGFGTRMLTANPDGNGPQGRDIRVIDDYGHTSHFIWRDPAHILAWAYHPSHGPAFYLYSDIRADGRPHPTPTVRAEPTVPSRRGAPSCAPAVVGKGVMTVNGHCTYLPGNEWILNDTYPDPERRQHLYLYHVESGERVPLGSFHAPEAYTGEWRCDLHPRASPDGRWVAIDSAHRGNGRQLYLVDIGDMIT
jgi:hypothetical protein